MNEEENSVSQEYQGVYYKKSVISNTLTFTKISETPIEGCGTTTTSTEVISDTPAAADETSSTTPTASLMMLLQEDEAS